MNRTRPEIGRHVHYYRNGLYPAVAPEAAIITWVHGPDVVNLVVFDANGNSRGETSVELVPPGRERPDCSHCTWMPYHLQETQKP